MINIYNKKYMLQDNELLKLFVPVCEQLIKDFSTRLTDEYKTIPNNGLKIPKDFEDYYFKIFNIHFKVLRKLSYSQSTEYNDLLQFCKENLYYICVSHLYFQDNKFIGFKKPIDYKQEVTLYNKEDLYVAINRFIKEQLTLHHIDLIKHTVQTKITHPQCELTYKQIKKNVFFILICLLKENLLYILLGNNIDIEYTIHRELSKFHHNDINEEYKILILKQKIQYFVIIERFLPENIYLFNPMKIVKPIDLIEHFKIYIDPSYLYDIIPKDGIYIYELVAKLCIIPFIKKDNVDDMLLTLKDNFIWLYGPNDYLENKNERLILSDEEKFARFKNMNINCVYDYIDNTSFSEKEYILRGGYKSSEAAYLFINNTERINYLKNLCHKELLCRKLEDCWFIYSYPTDLPYILYKSDHKYIVDNNVTLKLNKIIELDWITELYFNDLPKIIDSKKPCEIFEICKLKYAKYTKFDLFLYSIRDIILEQYCKHNKNTLIELYKKIKGKGNKDRIDKIVKLITIKMEFIYVNHPIYDWCIENVII